jgi:hypothetical protein
LCLLLQMLLPHLALRKTVLWLILLLKMLLCQHTHQMKESSLRGDWQVGYVKLL